MSKVGAIQDLVRGVKKILGTTRTEARDATISALVEDKQEREAKKFGIIAGISVVVIAIVVAGILTIRHKRHEHYQEYAAQYDDLKIDSYDNSGVIVNSSNAITINFPLKCTFKDSTLTPETAIERLGELQAADPGSIETYTAQFELVNSWLGYIDMSGIIHTVVEASDGGIVRIGNTISEEQLAMAEAALEIYYSSRDRIAELPANSLGYDADDFVDGILYSAKALNEDFRIYRESVRYIDAAKLYDLFAPYEPEAAADLEAILAEHPDALDG